MKVLVCGGRHYNDYARLEAELDGITNPIHGGKWSFTLICGMAPGADSLAYQWAKKRGVAVEEYPANWEEYGKAAGPIRNTQMLEEGKPDLVVAFPGGTGTADMVRKARAAGVEVKIIPED
jgi:hypothetical protein